MALPRIGSVVAGKYRIEALLGEGGMGAVYRAHHQLLDKDVALKWLHPRYTDNPDARERFLREARAVGRIKHPNVVELFDVSTHDGGLYMVMELLQGGTFEEQLVGPVDGSLPAALRLLLGAMRGVAEAHRCGIIHRDIKPENIFVVRSEAHPEGMAKVLDFGISKLTDELAAQHKTQTGTVMGTPAYMSFEHMSGSKNLDARTDIYSFGVVLYRTLTGVQPFDGDTLAAIALKVATHRPDPPSLLRPELPAELDQVVMKAMAFARAQRFATLDELIDALTPLASAEGCLASLSVGTGLPQGPVRSSDAPSPQPLEANLGEKPPNILAVETRKLDQAPLASVVGNTAAGRPTRKQGGLLWFALCVGALTAWLLWSRSAWNAPIQRSGATAEQAGPGPADSSRDQKPIAPVPRYVQDAPAMQESDAKSSAPRPVGTGSAQAERASSRPESTVDGPAREPTVPAQAAAREPSKARHNKSTEQVDPRALLKQRPRSAVLRPDQF